MNLPKIDISSLPDLDTPTGIHGSRLEQRTDDTLIVLMTYLYEIQHCGIQRPSAGIEWDAPRDLAFEVRPPADQPQRRQENDPRAFFQELAFFDFSVCNIFYSCHYSD